MAMSRTHHRIAVGLSVVAGLAATSGAASSPTAFAGPVTSLALEAGSASVVYAASAAGGVSKSVNGGRTWQRLAVPSGDVTDLVAHPTRPGVVYAAMGRKGVFKTKDGGRSWQAINTGLRGFRTKDSGRSWQAMSTGLRGLRVSVLAVARTEPEVVYAGILQGTPCSPPVVTRGPGCPRGRPTAFVFRSMNGGRSWHVVLKRFFNEVRDLTVDPKRASTIWATTYGHVLKSTDVGRTWRGVGGCTARACQLPGPMGVVGPRFPQITVNPRTPRIVYLGAGGGIFRSADGGRRWVGEPLPRRFTAFACDPLAADTLFVATNNGVYKRAEDGGRWQAVGRRSETLSLAIDSQGTTLYAGTSRGVVSYTLRQ